MVGKKAPAEAGYGEYLLLPLRTLINGTTLPCPIKNTYKWATPAPPCNSNEGCLFYALIEWG